MKQVERVSYCGVEHIRELQSKTNSRSILHYKRHHTEKDFPHPHELLVFGLWKTNSCCKSLEI